MMWQARLPSRWSRVAMVLGWVLVVPLVVLALARVLRLDRAPLTVWAYAATPVVFLPAYPALVLSFLSGRRALAAGAAVLVVLHLAWTVPEWRPARPLPDAVAGAPRLRLFSANLFYENTQPGIAEELAGSDSDVAVLQELTPITLGVLERAGALVRYPHQVLELRDNPFGIGIVSRFPLSDTSVVDMAGTPVVRATVALPSGPVRVYGLHTKAPFDRRATDEWHRQMETIEQAARGDLRPLIVAGDFNGTYGNRPFRSLLDIGLRDAHVERGRGWATTWPNGRRFPPLIRLDHVLVSPEIAVTGIREGKGEGSDHRPVIADLAIVG